MERVIFINSATIWGGGENWQFEIAEDLRDAVEIIFLSNPEGKLFHKAKAAGFSVVPFAVSNLSYLNPLKLFRAYKALKTISPRAILFNTSKDFKLFAIAGRLAGVTNILYRRDNGRALRSHMLNRYLLRRCVSKFIPCSQFIADSAFLDNPNLFQKEKVEVIYNSINIGLWDTQNVKENMVKREDGKFIIGCLGRLSQEKGQLFLPKIARVLLERGITNFEIAIAGVGPLREDLETLIERECVEEKVILYGFVEQSKSFISGIDSLIIPSQWEGLSTVAMEAMALSKPIIAFDVAANREQIIEGDSGFLIKPFDIEAMSDRIIDLISLDRDRLLDMGRAGRDLLERKFSRDTANNQLLKAMIMQKQSL